MKKVTIYFSFMFVLVLGCTDNHKEIIKEYHIGTNVPKEKIVYPNKRDTSNYIAICFYISGDTSGKYEYKNFVLKNFTSWFKSGKKSVEKNIVEEKETPYNGLDTVNGLIGLIEDIGTFRHWNENGVLIYETNLLSNRKEQRITRDSIGNVLKIDTISY